MGRRVRTNNSSPIDSAMEKYHSDIGNRLSGVFVPTASKPDLVDSTNTDFCMLTLDTRHMNSLKNKKNPSSPQLPLDATMTLESQPGSSTLESTAESLASSDSSTSPSSPPVTTTETDSHNKEKKGIVDKLTRALFQRKHTCSRCQRRSRSCLPNKNFNGTEKHYMCGNCRENAYAIKNLFSGLSALNTDSAAASADISPLSVSHTSTVQPRTENKDSGYDTVTSCSTLASAYSAFNTPEIQEKFAKNTTYCTHDATSQQTDSHSNNSKVKRSKSMPRVYSKPKVAAMVDNLHHQQDAPAEFHQLLMVGHHDLPGGVLRQVKTRNIKDYDGYLPSPQCPHQLDCIEHRLPLGDLSTNTTSHTSSSSSHHAHRKLPKSCHICGTSTKPCFHLPWEGGWLCEDCMDGML